jgi:hypothetical protein
MTPPPSSVNLVAVPKPHAPVWSATTDLRIFVEQFDTYLTLAGVAEDKHALRAQYLLVALPTDLVPLLKLETNVAPPGTFKEITERFLLKAGSPPKDPHAELAAFDTATVQPGETMSKFSGRLALLAANAYPNIPAETVNTLILNRFISSLAVTHPLIFRLAQPQNLTTLTQAVQYATEQVRREAEIARHAPAPAPAPTTSASLPASASSSVNTNMATASSSDTAIAEALALLRAVRQAPSRGNAPRARNYRAFPPRSRQDRNNYTNDNYQQARQQSYNRPGSAPPHIQCFNCGENHFVRDCPKGQWPGQH